MNNTQVSENLKSLFQSAGNFIIKDIFILYILNEIKKNKGSSETIRNE